MILVLASLPVHSLTLVVYVLVICVKQARSKFKWSGQSMCTMREASIC